LDGDPERTWMMVDLLRIAICEQSPRRFSVVRHDTESGLGNVMIAFDEALHRVSYDRSVWKLPPEKLADIHRAVDLTD
jgi:hypothetical protein